MMQEVQILCLSILLTGLLKCICKLTCMPSSRELGVCR
uniref:Uncharacterized protein n=1 Tax=Rhizophora mucronata TaxID=61149 RepID=A0A2P2NSF1_RHIMU